MKIDLARLARVAVQLAIAAPVIAAALAPVTAAIKPKATGS